MKRIMLALLMTGTVVTGNAAMHNKINDVPKDIQSSFSNQYAQARVKKWEMKNGDYVAVFKMSKEKCDAFYSPDGNWVKTETKIPLTRDLPVVVDDSWKESRFRAWEVDNVKEIKYSGNNSDVYRIKVHRDLGPDGDIPGDSFDTYVLYFDASGNLYKKDHLQ